MCAMFLLLLLSLSLSFFLSPMREVIPSMCSIYWSLRPIHLHTLTDGPLVQIIPVVRGDFVLNVTRFGFCLWKLESGAYKKEEGRGEREREG